MESLGRALGTNPQAKMTFVSAARSGSIDFSLWAEQQFTCLEIAGKSLVHWHNLCCWLVRDIGSVCRLHEISQGCFTDSLQQTKKYGTQKHAFRRASFLVLQFQHVPTPFSSNRQQASRCPPTRVNSKKTVSKRAGERQVVA